MLLQSTNDKLSSIIGDSSGNNSNSNSMSGNSSSNNGNSANHGSGVSGTSNSSSTNISSGGSSIGGSSIGGDLEGGVRDRRFLVDTAIESRDEKKDLHPYFITLWSVLRMVSSRLGIPIRDTPSLSQQNNFLKIYMCSLHCILILFLLSPVIIR